MYNPTNPDPPRVTVIPGSQPDPPKQNNFLQNMSSFLGNSAVGSAIGGLMNIASSAFNHHLAEKSAQSQYNRQLDFWHKQNEYNSPIEQRRRLQEAGLNPAVLAGDISGQNTAGGLSSVPGNDVAQRGVLDSTSLINSLQLYGQLESVSAGNDMMRRQIALSYAEELLKKNELYGIQLDNQEKQKLISWLDDEKKAALESLIAGTEETRARTGETKSRTIGLGIDNANKQRKYDDDHRAADDTHNISSAVEARAQSLFDLNKEYVKSVSDLGLKLNELELSRLEVSDLCKELVGVSLVSLPTEIQDYLAPLVSSLDNLVQSYDYFAEGSHRLKYSTVNEYLRAKKELSDSIASSKQDLKDVVTNFANDSYANHSEQYLKVLDAKLQNQKNLLDKVLSLLKK